MLLIGLMLLVFVGCAEMRKVKRAANTAAEVTEDVEKVKEATTPVVVDKYEPNDDLLNPTTIELNSTTKATIEPAGDVDVFKVHIASNKREVVQVTFQNPTRNLKPALSFYNQNREEIGDVDRQNQGAAKVSGKFIAQPNQDYYIDVCSGEFNAEPDNERSGKYYSLKVKLASVSDEYEPNESLTEAADISFGEIKGTINPAGDLDCYKIHTKKGGTVKITFVNPTLNLKPALSFYNQNREEIGDVDRQNQGAAKVSGKFIAQPNQDYYIDVCSGEFNAEPDNESSTKFYKLKVEMVE